MKNLGILVFLTGLFMVVSTILYVSITYSIYLMPVLSGILFMFVGIGMIDYASKN